MYILAGLSKHSDQAAALSLFRTMYDVQYGQSVSMYILRHSLSVSLLSPAIDHNVHNLIMCNIYAYRRIFQVANGKSIFG